MKNIKMALRLSNESIGEAVGIMEGWLGEIDMQKRDLLGLVLSLEETLLRWQDRFGSEKDFELIKCSRLGQPYLLLSLKGEEFDPLDKRDDELDWSTRFMIESGLAPEFRYSKGTNQVWIKLKKPPTNALLKIAAAGMTALLLGLLGMFLFPELAAQLQNAIIMPLRESLMGLITATAGPLVFLSVVQGIYGMENLSDFGKLGKSTIGRYILMSMAFAGFFSLLALPLFSLDFDKTEFSFSQLAATMEILTDILPDNMAGPFVSGNTLQIVVLATVTGLAILAMGERADRLKALADEAYSFMGMLLGWAGRLIPALVFLVVLENLWGSSSVSLAAIVRPLIISYCVFIFIVITALLVTALKLRVSVFALFKKALPPGLLAAATCSSSACVGRLMENSEKELGIDRKTANFCVPIGIITVKPATAAFFFILSVFCAQQYGHACSPAWIIMALLTALLLSVAQPPVPGGLLACYAALLAQLGLPAEALVLAISLDLFVDRVSTTVNVFVQQLLHVYNAHMLGMHDRNIFPGNQSDPSNQ